MTKNLVAKLVLGIAFMTVVQNALLAGEPVKYARFQVNDKIAYGRVQGERIHALAGSFANWKENGKTYALKEVRLLTPTEPTHVFAMAGNYKSHISKGVSTTTITTTTTVTVDPETDETATSTTTKHDVRRPGSVPEKFEIPQPFFKSPSSLTAHDTDIIIPADSTGVVHYEAEMVVVIGTKAKNISKESALDYVLGVTCGNDVSERTWQKDDIQWWRAKGSDTFGPCGPFIVSGIDYGNLQMRLRHNGEIVQDENTSQLLHDVSSCVSFISHHITLLPGDLIFTGTPGDTSVIKPGDVIEVTLDGVGVLRNRVVAE